MNEIAETCSFGTTTSMAGLTTASLVSLYEPETRFSLAKVLGLPAGLPNLALISLLSTAFFSISFLAFLNIGQTFVLTSLLNGTFSHLAESNPQRIDLFNSNIINDGIFECSSVMS
jgi:hypothetical protein